MGRAVALAAAVSSTEDVLAAYQAVVEARRSLGHVPSVSRGDLKSIVDRYRREAESDRMRGVISAVEHDDYIAAVEEAAGAVEFDLHPQFPPG